MFRFLFILFVVVPIIEITVLIQVGTLIGTWPTVAIVIITAWIGAQRVRQQGLMTLNSVQTKMAQGQMPSDEILAGMMLLVAGVLLVTPGFVTDLFGIALLFPTIRQALINAVKQHFVISQTRGAVFDNHHSQSFSSSTFADEADKKPVSRHQGKTLDGEFERKE